MTALVSKLSSTVTDLGNIFWGSREVQRGEKKEVNLEEIRVESSLSEEIENASKEGTSEKQESIFKTKEESSSDVERAALKKTQKNLKRYLELNEFFLEVTKRYQKEIEKNPDWSCKARLSTQKSLKFNESVAKRVTREFLDQWAKEGIDIVGKIRDLTRDTEKFSYALEPELVRFILRLRDQYQIGRQQTPEKISYSTVEELKIGLKVNAVKSLLGTKIGYSSAKKDAPFLSDQQAAQMLGEDFPNVIGELEQLKLSLFPEDKKVLEGALKRLKASQKIEDSIETSHDRLVVDNISENARELSKEDEGLRDDSIESENDEKESIEENSSYDTDESESVSEALSNYINSELKHRIRQHDKGIEKKIIEVFKKDSPPPFPPDPHLDKMGIQSDFWRVAVNATREGVVAIGTQWTARFLAWLALDAVEGRMGSGRGYGLLALPAIYFLSDFTLHAQERDQNLAEDEQPPNLPWSTRMGMWAAHGMGAITVGLAISNLATGGSVAGIILAQRIFASFSLARLFYVLLRDLIIYPTRLPKISPIGVKLVDEFGMDHKLGPKDQGFANGVRDLIYMMSLTIGTAVSFALPDLTTHFNLSDPFVKAAAEAGVRIPVASLFSEFATGYATSLAAWLVKFLRDKGYFEGGTFLPADYLTTRISLNKDPWQELFNPQEKSNQNKSFFKRLKDYIGDLYNAYATRISITAGPSDFPLAISTLLDKLFKNNLSYLAIVISFLAGEILSSRVRVENRKEGYVPGVSKVIRGERLSEDDIDYYSRNFQQRVKKISAKLEEVKKKIENLSQEDLSEVELEKELEITLEDFAKEVEKVAEESSQEVHLSEAEESSKGKAQTTSSRRKRTRKPNGERKGNGRKRKDPSNRLNTHSPVRGEKKNGGQGRGKNNRQRRIKIDV